jgi:predicted ABC-type exoprotein transport system permease subunit
MKKIFSKNIVYPFFTLLGIIAIFDWIVFPLLTAADTLGNILGVVIAFFTLVYAYFEFGVDKFFKKDLED